MTNELFVATFTAANIRDDAKSTYYFFNRFNPELPIQMTRNQPHLNVCEGKENHPVVGISWLGATMIAYLLGGRLPYVSEWREFAATQPGARYPWGDEEISESHANVEYFRGGTTPVGQYPSFNGLSDLIGNAEEWCMDWFETRTLAAQSKAGSWQGDFEKAVVGGSWSTPVTRTGINICRGKWYRIGTRNIGCRIVWDNSLTGGITRNDPFSNF